ncbi:MAG: hypothetical protein K0R72_23 [Clostridia bacterium]|jgi:hypothetical protein|nr:hypothetical protein [Clostridia bacterium]
MSAFKLREYQSKSISDLYMAIIVEKLSDEEAKRHRNALKPQDEGYAEVKKLDELVDNLTRNALNESNLDSTSAKQITDIMKDAISFAFEKSAAIIVMKFGDTYVNLNDDQEINVSTHTLRNLEPFSDYYAEDEYRFLELDGKVVLDVDSFEPFEEYEKKFFKKQDFIVQN